MTTPASLFRANIAAMEGYTPGEQPQGRTFIKLNTNENPYPPTPAIAELLRSVDLLRLARYPDPVANRVREAAAELHHATRDWFLAGNGSDDLLTILVRSFVDQGGALACLDPTYSLYPVLAELQGARTLTIPLTDSFGIPADFLAYTRGASLLLLTRPNAPTGVACPLDLISTACTHFPGVVVVDEAYVDFAEDHAADLVHSHANLVILRTLSKSYSLAGIRLGYAFAQPPLIAGMMKAKDSYNVNALTQLIGEAALRDQLHMRANADRIRHTRARVSAALTARGFTVLPSATNFIFARPPAVTTAAALKQALYDRGIIIRHFPAPRTAPYIRVTIGTDADMDAFLTETTRLCGG